MLIDGHLVQLQPSSSSRGKRIGSCYSLIDHIDIFSFYFISYFFFLLIFILRGSFLYFSSFSCKLRFHQLGGVVCMGYTCKGRI